MAKESAETLIRKLLDELPKLIADYREVMDKLTPEQRKRLLRLEAIMFKIHSYSLFQ